MNWSVELKLERLWCDAHQARFDPTPSPAMLAVATGVLFTGFANLPDIIRYCDGGEGRKADPGRLDAALREFQPACCRVDAAWLDRIIAATVAGDTDTLRQLQEEVIHPCSPS